MAKHWEDQPDVVADLAVMSHFYADGVVIEVRKGSYYYVTTHSTGHHTRLDRTVLVDSPNLFGSQTVRCPNADAAFMVIQQAFNKTNSPADVPEGCEVLK